MKTAYQIGYDAWGNGKPYHNPFTSGTEYRNEYLRGWLDAMVDVSLAVA